jgi:hypothetical protein
MKKGLFCLVFLGLLLFGVTTGSVSALDFKAYPSGIEQGDFIINAGLGFGSPLYGTMSIPPIIAGLDYALPIGGLPFTVGGLVGFNRSKAETSVPASAYTPARGYIHTYTGIVIAGRLGYHPDLGVKNLDVYADLALGYYIYNAKTEYTGDWSGWPKTNAASLSTFYWGTYLGARYFFTPMIGAFLELGYSPLYYASAGVAIKF